MSDKKVKYRERKDEEWEKEQENEKYTKREHNSWRLKFCLQFALK